MANRIGAGGPFLATPLPGDVPPPFVPYDDSRPTLRRTLAFPLQWTESGNLLLTTLAPNPVVRDPLATHVPRQPPLRREEQYPNLVLRQVVALVVLPFNNPDFGKLKVPTQRREEQYPNLVLAQVVNVVQPPFQNVDMSLPKRPLDQSGPAFFFNSVIMPEGPKPFFGYEVSQPTNPVLLQAESFPNFQVLQLAPVAPPPFIPVDWPRQPRLLRLQPIDLPPNLLESTLAPLAQPPFFGQPQENARLPRRADRDVLQNLLESTLGLPITPPFSQTDWPRPALTKLGDRHLAVNLLESTLGLPVVVTPNLHRLVMDLDTGRLGWMVSGVHTGDPIIVVFFD